MFDPHRTRLRQFILLLLLGFAATAPFRAAALPKRLIVALDGIAYRDLRTLQEGVSCRDSQGKPIHRQAFREGYFPVSRLVSTFPSTSDVAWTEIFGNRPMLGYQRTYYSIAANRTVFLNGVTSSMEYEQQATWRVENRFHFAMSYVRPLKEFQYEVDRMVQGFLDTTCTEENYYALMLSTDAAQHMAADIFAMLCTLDERLRDLRAVYQAREGRDLEILILSDHGNNHAGRGQRVEVKKFLKHAGYRVRRSLAQTRDVVLPTMGIESWVELHNVPAETERLVELLSHLKGVDVLTAQVPGCDDRFIVMNSKGERAIVGWDAANDALRYEPESGDPLEYLPVVDALRRKGLLDPKGFGGADAWLAATLTHRYPVALERIVHGHTRVTLNPATILISLANDHVHAGWLVNTASGLMRVGGTHGALDDLNSTGALLSSFAPTRDTSTRRVAELYEGFPGLHDHRRHEDGAEWVSGACQAMVTISRGPLDWARHRLPSDQIFLRVWTPRFSHENLDAPVAISIAKVRPVSAVRIRRGDPEPRGAEPLCFTLAPPLPFPGSDSYERVYAAPPGLMLEPRQEYRITGSVRAGNEPARLFAFNFIADDCGQPVAY